MSVSLQFGEQTVSQAEVDHCAFPCVVADICELGVWSVGVGK